jgi:hypothetical protein
VGPREISAGLVVGHTARLVFVRDVKGKSVECEGKSNDYPGKYRTWCTQKVMFCTYMSNVTVIVRSVASEREK